MLEKNPQPVPDASFPSSLFPGHHVAGALLETPTCALLRGHSRTEGSLLGRAVWELSPLLGRERGWQPAAAAHPPGLGTGRRTALQKPFAAAPCIQLPEKLTLLRSHGEGGLPGACPAALGHAACGVSPRLCLIPPPGHSPGCPASLGDVWEGPQGMSYPQHSGRIAGAALLHAAREGTWDSPRPQGPCCMKSPRGRAGCGARQTPWV